MAAQYPIDGKFKVTSTMGWRIHPIKKVKKFHTGTDMWTSTEPCPIEAPYAGWVKEVGKTPSAGNFVVMRHKIRGEYYTTKYMHMKDDSIKVKVNTHIEAGTVIGKMGTTGMSTGKHLHWELQKGKKYVWNNTGKNFIEPVAFFKALIEWEKSIATAPVEANENDPVVAPAPTHDAKGAAQVAKTNSAATRPTIKKGSKAKSDVIYLQKKLGVETNGADGVFGPKTHAAVVAFQKKSGLTANGIVDAKTWAKIG